MIQKLEFKWGVQVEAVQYTGDNDTEIFKFYKKSFKPYGGEMKITINDKTYTLKKNDWLVKFQDEIHIFSDYSVKHFCQVVPQIDAKVGD